MVNFFTPPGLEGLFDLDSKGVDIRPTLLRVLTDQFLQSPAHTPDEKQRYTELATRLFDEVDLATRATVSARLAPHADAPRSIILNLARDVLEVAEPVLLHSPCLTPADCEAVIAERGPAYAEILAKRRKSSLPATETPRLLKPSQPSIGKAEVAAMPAAKPAIDADACELCELFFAADSFERRLMLMNLDFAQWQVSAPSAPLQRTDIWRIETAALRHHTTTVTQEIERALGISYQQARRVVEDDQGEPIVAAAKAMGLPADVLQRILLFMNPKVGQSVDRIYELAQLYDEISTQAACRMVAIMRAAGPNAETSQDLRARARAMATAQRALAETASQSVRKLPASILRRATGN
jgi:hypothetical protein